MFFESISEECQNRLDRLRSDMDANFAMISTFENRKHNVRYVSQKYPANVENQEIPIEYSICRHVEKMNFSLRIDDTQSHPLVVSNPLIGRDSIGSYAGVPIPHPKRRDKPLGVICVIFDRLHGWNDAELDQIQNVAQGLTGVMRKENLLPWLNRFFN